MAFGLRADGDGTDLGEMLTVDVQGRAAEKLVSFGLHDGEGADVGADLFVGAAKKGAVVGKAFDELVDGVSILQICSTRAHEVCFELGAEGGGARLRRSYRRGADRMRKEGCRRFAVEVGREGLGRRFYYEGQCHMPLRFSLLVARTGAGWLRVEV